MKADGGAEGKSIARRKNKVSEGAAAAEARIKKRIKKTGETIAREKNKINWEKNR